MKRVAHIAKNYDEAEQWDIKQAINMSHEARQKVASILKKRVFGDRSPDVKEYYRNNGTKE